MNPDRTSSPPGMRNILIPVDRSQGSVQAVKYATAHLFRHGDKLHLVHVTAETPSTHQWPAVYKATESVIEEEFKEVVEMINHMYVPILTRGQVVYDVHLMLGPEDCDGVAKLVLEKANQLQPLMIVVGAKGKGWLEKVWLGSVTDYLVHTSPWPVMVVKALEGDMDLQEESD